MTAMGWCAPQQTYHWGFSLILLFMFLSVTWILSIPLYFVYIIHFWKTYQQSTATEKVFGTSRTPLVVAESVRFELGGMEVDRMEERQIREMLRSRGAGMRVRRQMRESEGVEMRPKACRSRNSTLTTSSTAHLVRGGSETGFP